ncbi:zinc dependent phospholipase C family protein [Paenibacillus solisilvae]|uniref:Zinc dependent phospholipase C family protein n=1 Tax=Paenibacillus solisilvae TaxID=2486751 RepID=A0ABW0W088_9BACL
MGSRIMHYCIASLLSERLGLTNVREFLLGGIAPDIHAFMEVTKPKRVTHFVDVDEHGKGRINVLRYYNTYKEFVHEPFYLGYLCHLISDVVWSDMYDTFIQNMSMEERKETLQICYRDYWRLNGRLINHYALDHKTLPISREITINEVHFNSYLPALLEWLQKDFSFDEEVASQTLELFQDDNTQIIEFIDSSVQKSLAFINEQRLLG